MNVAETIKTAHAALADGRCWPNRFQQPQNAPPAWPAIRFTVVGRDIDLDLCGTDAGDSDNIRVQIDYVAEGYEDARDLRDAGVAAMRALATPCARVGEFETFDTETKTHRFVVDFLLMPSST